MIDLSGKTCNVVSEMPRGKFAHVALWDNRDQSVLCCGGGDQVGDPRQCFKYTGAEWMNLGDILIGDRSFSSTVELSDGRYWISGDGGKYEQLKRHIAPVRFAED